MNFFVAFVRFVALVSLDDFVSFHDAGVLRGSVQMLIHRLLESAMYPHRVAAG